MFPAMAEQPRPPREPMRREALSIDAAAQLLDVSAKTLRRLIRARKLQAFRVGRQWRIRRDVLAEWSRRQD